LRENTSKTYVGMLTSLNDPRVYVTSEPATALVKAGASPTSFQAFVGADPGEDLGIMYIKANGGEYSLINRKHFYDSYTGERVYKLASLKCVSISPKRLTGVG
jgi:hypothetical protein